MYFSCNGRVVALRFVIRTYVLGMMVMFEMVVHVGNV